MEALISNLVSRFEKGALTRRQLVNGLTALAAAGGSTAALAQEGGIKAAKIDHISIQVKDLPKSIAFYQKMFGLAILNEDKPNEIVRMGVGKVLVSLHHKKPHRNRGPLRHRRRKVQPRNRDQRIEGPRRRNPKKTWTPASTSKTPKASPSK